MLEPLYEKIFWQHDPRQIHPNSSTKFKVWLNLNVKIILTFLCTFLSSFYLIFMSYCIVNSVKGIESLSQTQML